MSEATSKRGITTEYGRGTTCYRAPELLDQEKDRITFTNKVDIWALGCIISEMVTGHRVFDNDWTVYRYYTSTITLSFETPNCPRILEEHLNRLVGDLLRRNYKERPGVALLCPLFKSYLLVMCVSLQETIDIVQGMEHYDPWTKVFYTCATEEEVQLQLISHFVDRKDYKSAAAFSLQMLVHNPHVQLMLQLKRLYELNGDWDYAIRGWKSLVMSHPNFNAAHLQLTMACLRKGGHAAACQEWAKIIDRHPTNNVISQTYTELSTKRLKLDDWEGDGETFKALVLEFPSEPWYQDELCRALDRSTNHDSTVMIWKELVGKHPLEGSLHDRLWHACTATNDAWVGIEVWRELLIANPDCKEFSSYLNIALRGRKIEDAIAIWGKILMTHSEHRHLQGQLYQSLSSLGTEERNTVWATLVSDYPSLANYGPRVAQRISNGMNLSLPFTPPKTEMRNSPYFKLVGKHACNNLRT